MQKLQRAPAGRAAIAGIVWLVVSLTTRTATASPQIANGDFECGPGLAGWTTGGINGGFAELVQEGTCFSATNTLGLTFDGSFAAKLRSSAPAPTDSVGILTSDAFVAGNAVAFNAVSENGDFFPDPNPVTLEVRILDASGLTALLSQVVAANVVTLAFGGVPDGSCSAGDLRNGTFSSHAIDTSAFAGQAVRVEFRQHTNDARYGWFTLIDDVIVPDGGPPPFTCGATETPTATPTPTPTGTPTATATVTATNTPLRPLGSTCTAPGQCQSGFCVDNVCCGTQSCLAGESCNVSGQEGQCHSSPPTSTPISLVYYALGDSIASGHGLPGGTGQFTGVPNCRQSPNAYPDLVFNQLTERYRGRYDVKFRSLACSGAKSFWSHQSSPLTDLPQQVNEFLVTVGNNPFFGDQVTLISTTVGVNDFDFPDEVTHGTEICQPDDVFKQWVETTSRLVEATMEHSLRRLLCPCAPPQGSPAPKCLCEGKTPNVFVIVTDYFNPFNHTSGYFDLLRVGLKSFSATDLNPKVISLCAARDFFGLGDFVFTDRRFYVRTERVVASLNQALMQAVTTVGMDPMMSHRLRFVTFHNAFQGHESASPNCGTSSPEATSTYIQYPADFSVDAAGVFVVGEAEFKSMLLMGNDCFHSNEQGALLYATGGAGVQGVIDAAQEMLP